MLRNYTPLLALARPIADRAAAMAHVVDVLWRAFGEEDPSNPRGGLLSWIGFYEITPTHDEMLLVCRQPKPACSPIGLQGMCGRGWKERKSFVVHDVAFLGENYIACDPRDKSELVIPMLNADGSCWGVLDVDSYNVGAFSADDASKMGELCQRLGLTYATAPCEVL